MVILITEDDEGHATLIRKNLRRSGITNEIRHFNDGQGVLDFLLGQGAGDHRKEGVSYLILLDIRMPKVDGIEVLRQIKGNEQLKTIPVIMITTTDDQRDVENCHYLGCNNYITKPVDYDKFVAAIRQLGLFLTIVEVPSPQNFS